MQKHKSEARMLFWGLISSVVALDVITKAWAVSALTRIPRPVFGDWLTFQLVYNPGAAFGINVGSYSRVTFLVLGFVALGVLATLARQTEPSDKIRIAALALVCGGAVGNLIDRVRSARGVVDFIDVGIGMHRWPTFNIADIAVTVGALVLAFVLWDEGKNEDAKENRATGEAVETST
ncbi:MAG: signal peptidase II [Gemmatimonadota bacterium]|nr:signal peptidase II [Gemmatimonadota bacterium]MDH5803724.1 signal peptidase II [Gemmatimonadota bacterium]